MQPWYLNLKTPCRWEEAAAFLLSCLTPPSNKLVCVGLAYFIRKAELWYCLRRVKVTVKFLDSDFLKYIYQIPALFDVMLSASLFLAMLFQVDARLQMFSCL